MKITRNLLMGAIATGTGMPLLAPPSQAADPKEMSKDIIAVQIRKQGFECKSPEKAERDQSAGNPDDPVWTLTCNNAIYRVHLIPNQAATVERLSNEEHNSEQPQQQN